MQYRDYYEILGLTRSADADEVKRAYRKLARKFHPDVIKEKNAAEKFKEVQEAYEVLRDSDKRAAYDQLGRDFRNGQQFRPPPDWSQRFGNSGGQRFSDLNGFSDFFSSLFGGGGLGGGNSGQGDADAGHLDVTVEEAFAGTKRRVTLNEHGRQRQVDVQIPAGVTEGQPLRIPGVGGRASLIFRIRLRPHHLYEVAGKDVQIELPSGTVGGGFGCEGRGSDAGRNRGADRTRRSPVRPEAQAASQGISGQPCRRPDGHDQIGDAGCA